MKLSVQDFFTVAAAMADSGIAPPYHVFVTKWQWNDLFYDLNHNPDPRHPSLPDTIVLNTPAGEVYVTVDSPGLAKP